MFDNRRVPVRIRANDRAYQTDILHGRLLTNRLDRCNNGLERLLDEQPIQSYSSILKARATPVRRQ